MGKEKEIELRYFERVLDCVLSDDKTYDTKEMWDRRAGAWEKDASDLRKKENAERIRVAVEYLTGHGLLGWDCDVVDIGCGLGYFVAAFARTSRAVLGLDFSEKMIQHGIKHAEREKLQNTSFRVCDFRTLDIEKEGLAGKFDLAFCSLTPAINGTKGLKKTIEMSRQYCCNISHLHSSNEFERRVMREVFGRERRDPWTGHLQQFHAMFNVLLLMGYFPEVYYHRIRQERAINAVPDRIALFMEQMLPHEERTAENAERILDWMQKHESVETEIRETCYGYLLWDVRERK